MSLCVSQEILCSYIAVDFILRNTLHDGGTAFSMPYRRFFKTLQVYSLTVTPPGLQTVHSRISCESCHCVSLNIHYRCRLCKTEYPILQVKLHEEEWKTHVLGSLEGVTLLISAELDFHVDFSGEAYTPDGDPFQLNLPANH